MLCGGDVMVYLHLKQPKPEHWLSYIGTDVPDTANVSPLSVQKQHYWCESCFVLLEQQL